MSKLLSTIDDLGVQRETLGETLKNLGVEVEKRGALTGVRWAPPRHARKDSDLITVTERGIYIPNAVCDDLKKNGGDKVLLGIGTYQGQTVLLIKADPCGYKPTSPKKARKAQIVVPKVINGLLRAGLKPGSYEPQKIKGGWMGVPE